MASGFLQRARGAVAAVVGACVGSVSPGGLVRLPAATAACGGSVVGGSPPCGGCVSAGAGSLLPCSVLSNIPFHISSVMEDGLSCCCWVLAAHGGGIHGTVAASAVPGGWCCLAPWPGQGVPLVRHPFLHEALAVWWRVFAGPAAFRVARWLWWRSFGCGHGSGLLLGAPLECCYCRLRVERVSSWPGTSARLSGAHPPDAMDDGTLGERRGTGC